MPQGVELLTEFLAKARTLCVSTPAHFQDFVFGLRPEDNFPRHVLAQELGSDLGPRNGRAWVPDVFCPALIEFGTGRVRELEGIVSLAIGETLPQGDRQLGAVTGRQFEKFRQRARRHGPMVARLARRRQFERVSALVDGTNNGHRRGVFTDSFKPQNIVNSAIETVPLAPWKTQRLTSGRTKEGGGRGGGASRGASTPGRSKGTRTGLRAQPPALDVLLDDKRLSLCDLRAKDLVARALSGRRFVPPTSAVTGQQPGRERPHLVRRGVPGPVPRGSPFPPAGVAEALAQCGASSVARVIALRNVIGFRSRSTADRRDKSTRNHRSLTGKSRRLNVAAPIQIRPTQYAGRRLRFITARIRILTVSRGTTARTETGESDDGGWPRGRRCRPPDSG